MTFTFKVNIQCQKSSESTTFETISSLKAKTRQLEERKELNFEENLLLFETCPQNYACALHQSLIFKIKRS